MKLRDTCEQESLGELKIIITSDVPDIIITTYKDGRPLEVEIKKMSVVHDEKGSRIIIKKLVIQSLASR